MADKISNNLIATLLVVAIVVSIVGLSFGFGAFSITGRAGGGVNVTVGNLTGCAMSSGYNDAAFGSMTQGDTNDTTATSPNPLRIENTGNTYINVSVNATVGASGPYISLWSDQTAIEEDSGRYLWAAANNTSGFLNATYVGNYVWLNVSNVSTEIVAKLAFAGTNTTDLEINVTVPDDEGEGSKTDLITFTCWDWA